MALFEELRKGVKNQMPNITTVSPAYQKVSGKTILRELHYRKKHQVQSDVNRYLSRKCWTKRQWGRTAIPGGYFVSIIDCGKYAYFIYPIDPVLFTIYN